MGGSIHAEIEPGQILSDAGVEQFRSMVQNRATLRCSNLWMASAHRVDDDEIEIEIYCSLDHRTERWDAEVYYYDLDRAVIALREYERTGNMPEGE